MSDRERTREICELTRHDWQEEYYGYECSLCGEFIPYGCEPWMPLGDDVDPDDDLLDGEE